MHKNLCTKFYISGVQLDVSIEKRRKSIFENSTSLSERELDHGLNY